MKKAENTFISSTFWGERAGYAAGLSTIKELKRLDAFKKVNENGKNIKKIWSELSIKHNVSISIKGSNAIPSFEFFNNNLLLKLT